jgi:hypothetical protein
VRSTRRNALVVALALVVLATLGDALAHRGELLFRWRVWRLTSAEPAQRKAAARELASLGEPGFVVLEAVAFDTAAVDTGSLALRQAALDLVWEHEPAPPGAELSGFEVADVPRRRPEEARLIRYLREARGLWRPGLEHALLDPKLPPTDALVSAAIETMLADPSADAAESCFAFLLQRNDPRALQAFRHGVVSCRASQVRLECCRVLGAAPDPVENPPVLRQALDDPDERVRVAAASDLAVSYNEAVGLRVLVQACRKTAPNDVDLVLEDATAGLAALADPRTFGLLVWLHDSATFAQRRRAVAEDALEKLVADEHGGPYVWGPWFEAHRSEFPPQLENPR